MRPYRSRPDIGLFWCSICKQLLERHLFHSNKSARDGIQNHCKQCTAARYAAKKPPKPKPTLAERLTPEQLTEHQRAIHRRYRERHPGRSAEKVRISRRKHLDARRAYARDYQKKNLERFLAHNAQRKEHIKRATPPWADKKVILDLYILAKVLSRDLGTQIDVDHIVPLKGKNVCGLHVQNNLRLLPHLENVAKHNKFEEVSS